MNLQYTVKFSNRKTVRISVERDKSVVVLAPNATDLNEIKRKIEEKKFWIYRKINHAQKHEASEKRRYVSGSSVMFLGKTYTLRVARGEFDGVVFDGHLTLAEQSLSAAADIFRDWFKAQAGEYIVPKTAELAEKLGVDYNSVKISGMRYRWGSCTKKNNLNFNWRLIKAPPSVIDYIILHELAHILESGHGKKFWQIVKTQNINYVSAKNWLRSNGGILETD